jgi:hypothetical protein
MPAFRFIYLESDNVEGTAQMVREVISRMQPALPASAPTAALLSSDGGAASGTANLGKTESPASSSRSSGQSQSGGAETARPSAPKKRRCKRKPRPVDTPTAAPAAKTDKRRSPLPAGVKSVNEQRADHAEAILRKAGRPMYKGEVAKLVKIPNGCSTAVWRDERFETTSDGQLWLADTPDPRGDGHDEEDGDEDGEEEDDEEPPPPAPKPPPPKRVGPPTVSELVAIIRSKGPMNASEVARHANSTYAACHRVLQDEAFEYSEGLYWAQ